MIEVAVWDIQELNNMKNFIKELEKGLNKIFKNKVRVVVDYVSGKFIVTANLVNDNCFIISAPDIELVECRFGVSNECKIISEFIDFPFLGYPEFKTKDLSLEKSKEFILEVLSDGRTEFIFDNLLK